MEGKITIDQIGTQSMYDLVKICDNNDSDEDFNDSPFATLDTHVITMIHLGSKIYLPRNQIIYHYSV